MGAKLFPRKTQKRERRKKQRTSNFAKFSILNRPILASNNFLSPVPVHPDSVPFSLQTAPTKLRLKWQNEQAKCKIWQTIHSLAFTVNQCAIFGLFWSQSLIKFCVFGSPKFGCQARSQQCSDALVCTSLVAICTHLPSLSSDFMKLCACGTEYGCELSAHQISECGAKNAFTYN